MVFIKGGRAWAGFQHPTEVFKITVFYIETSVCDYSDLSFCHFVTVELHLFWGKKTSCMIQQCFQSCCIYPLWILCDCTVLYLSITGNYMVLYVCQGLYAHSHTLTNTHRIPYNQSNIVSNWSKCTLTGLVSRPCVFSSVKRNIQIAQQASFKFFMSKNWSALNKFLSKWLLSSLEVQISPEVI